MLVAIPLEENRDLESDVAEHFGRVRFFLIYDTESKAHRIIDFVKREEGVCAPAVVLVELGVDAVYVLGMGYRARCMLEEAGVVVLTGPYRRAKDVVENLDRLERFEGGCSHH